MLFTGTLKVLL